jgi:hypothetical protein
LYRNIINWNIQFFNCRTNFNLILSAVLSPIYKL